jgi:hypothetical protein
MLRCPRIRHFGLHRLREAMNAIRPIFMALLLAWLGWGSFSEASGEGYVMPREFVQYAEAHGCLQLSDFFDRSGPVNPPYVYGYLKGSEEDSGVFWCKKKIADDKPHLLMIFARHKEISSSTCPQHIEWWNPPGGLSIHQDKSLTLGSFMKVTDPHQSGPKNQRLEHNAIMSSYDGVSVVFYCHRGEWYFGMSH